MRPKVIEWRIQIMGCQNPKVFNVVRLSYADMQATLPLQCRPAIGARDWVVWVPGRKKWERGGCKTFGQMLAAMKS